MSKVNEIWFIYKQKFKDDVADFVTKSAKKAKLKNKILFYEKFKIINDNLFYNDVIIKKFPKIAFVRIYDFIFNKFLMDKGVVVVNNPFSMSLCQNKFLTHTFLKQFKIKQPKFLLYENQSFAELKKSLGIPLVVKDNLGEKGTGVFLVSNNKEFIFAKKNIKNSISYTNVTHFFYNVTLYKKHFSVVLYQRGKSK